VGCGFRIRPHAHAHAPCGMVRDGPGMRVPGCGCAQRGEARSTTRHPMHPTQDPRPGARGGTRLAEAGALLSCFSAMQPSFAFEVAVPAPVLQEVRHRAERWIVVRRAAVLDMFSWDAQFVVNYFIERNVQRRRKSRCRFSVCRKGSTALLPTRSSGELRFMA
jgi:hypothetical protein